MQVNDELAQLEAEFMVLKAQIEQANADALHFAALLDKDPACVL
jgi:hypothetical protein